MGLHDLLQRWMASLYVRVHRALIYNALNSISDINKIHENVEEHIYYRHTHIQTTFRNQILDIPGC
jgi:hypothetical protein